MAINIDKIKKGLERRLDNATDTVSDIAADMYDKGSSLVPKNFILALGLDAKSIATTVVGTAALNAAKSPEKAKELIDNVVDNAKSYIKKEKQEQKKSALRTRGGQKTEVKEGVDTFHNEVTDPLDNIFDSYTKIMGINLFDAKFDKKDDVSLEESQKAFDKVEKLGRTMARAQNLAISSREKLQRGSLSRKDWAEDTGMAMGVTSMSALMLEEVYQAKGKRDNTMNFAAEKNETIRKNAGMNYDTLVKEERAIKKGMKIAIKKLAEKEDSPINGRREINKIVDRTYEDAVMAAEDNMSQYSDEELALMGLVRIKGYTRKDGVKIRDHYREI